VPAVNPVRIALQELNWTMQHIVLDGFNVRAGRRRQAHLTARDRRILRRNQRACQQKRQHKAEFATVYTHFRHVGSVICYSLS